MPKLILCKEESLNIGNYVRKQLLDSVRKFTSEAASARIESNVRREREVFFIGLTLFGAKT